MKNRPHGSHSALMCAWQWWGPEERYDASVLYWIVADVADWSGIQVIVYFTFVNRLEPCDSKSVQITVLYHLIQFDRGCDLWPLTNLTQLRIWQVWWWPVLQISQECSNSPAVEGWLNAVPMLPVTAGNVGTFTQVTSTCFNDRKWQLFVYCY